MKPVLIAVSLLLLHINASCTDRQFTASTPCGDEVRWFLDISKTDSVDFVRWHLSFSKENYTLECNYGMGKPNTNGFINGGKKIVLTGSLTKEKNIYTLKNGTRNLALLEINGNLLHLLNAQQQLLVGNGGWSYTLNSLTPSPSGDVDITAQKSSIKDSLVYEGRTPCAVPGVIDAGMECYKLKWLLVLYPSAENNAEGRYRIWGTPYRKTGRVTGNWQLISNSKGNLVYQLHHDNQDKFLYLLKADENILVFMDEKGNLLTGNEDFSYTLNRRSDKKY